MTTLGDELAAAESALRLAAVLPDVEDLLTRYVVFRSRAQVAAVTLWVAHTHALGAFDVTPYLNVRSAEKGAGKTRLLEVLTELVPRPWHAVQPTEAVLFRRIHRDTPTLLLDETDALLTKSSGNDRSEAVRGVLNAGYRRGATVDRVNLKSKNPLESYRVFCAKAFAGIGTLPGTVADRAIPIELARRKRSEPIARFFLREARPDLHRVRDALGAWAQDAVDLLRDARPALPEALADRAAEVWEALLAVADLAGSEWPPRGRAAALELHQGRTDTDSTNVVLLHAVREVFEAPRAQRLLTIELLKALVDREGEPWPGWWGKDVDLAKDGETPRKPAMELARHLRPFGVQPRKLRVGDCTGNGYDRADLEDAFARYLPPAVDFGWIGDALAARFSQKQPLGRNNGTPVAAQGFEAFRPTPGESEVGTPETVAAQGVCRRSDLEAVSETRTEETGASPPQGHGVTVEDVLAIFPGARIVHQNHPGSGGSPQGTTPEPPRGQPRASGQRRRDR